MCSERNCIQCVYCDGINHAPVGSGSVELGCQRERRGYYVTVGSGYKAESCLRFTMKEFFKK